MRFQVEASPAVEIAPSALLRIRDLSRESRRHETGGILVGFNDGRDIRIIDASDPGPKARRSSTHFLRDTAHCQDFLEAQYKSNGADYVGEWHSHVVSLNRLSGGDLSTIARLFVDPDYDFVSFAIVLVALREAEPELHVYLAERLPTQGQFVNSRPCACTRVIVTQVYSGRFPDELTEPG